MAKAIVLSLLSSLTVQTFFILFIVFLIAVKIWQQPKNLPPGPWGFPIFGALPRMGRKPYLVAQKWWMKYGDIYSLYMGSRLCVVLNGVEVMKECLVKQGDRFSGRPWNYFKKITGGTGMVFKIYNNNNNKFGSNQGKKINFLKVLYQQGFWREILVLC